LDAQLRILRAAEPTEPRNIITSLSLIHLVVILYRGVYIDRNHVLLELVLLHFEVFVVVLPGGRPAQMAQSSEEISSVS
jgi:hypothetical protein